MRTLRHALKRLRDRWILPTSGTVSVRDLNQRFQPVPPGSMRSLLLKMTMLADVAEPVGGSTHPYYRRSKPHFDVDATSIASDPTYIDFANVCLPPYGELNTVDEAVRLFDARAAAAVSAAVGSINSDFLQFIPSSDPTGGHFVPSDAYVSLLEVKTYGGDLPDVVIPTAQCLAVIAYPDYFPGIHDDNSWRMVSEAILAANPGWCGTGVRGGGGDYDMSQMHLLQIAYRYYDELHPDAREHLITSLLAKGTIRRYGSNVDDVFTSGRVPNDWSRLGHISFKRVGETENHILMMHTARYLTNQLLYQRDHDPDHDNRRNGSEDAPTCTDLILYLLRNILRDDFSEYNAKNYQTQTRYALLNLYSYAYDHEVRLAARMVLDYVSAHIAVSSNDLRRMVPFRRRNEGKNVTRDDRGFMDVSLLETTWGADPMAQHFAILAGNTRIYETRAWHIKTDGTDGNDAVMYALSDYRLPPSIHDLFVNDLHRRFFQRLHRIFQDDVEVTGRNADNFEIYAGSPSYLISAGGSPATYAIDPTVLGVAFGDDPAQQLGVAVTTSFMPTMRLDLNCGDPTRAIHLIQFGHFSDVEVTQTVDNVVYNYGVAPDFACGHQVNLPLWCDMHTDERYGKFEFVCRGSAGSGPGFFLAFLRDGGLTVMEAFDTWLHPDLTFEEFKRNVFALNKDLMNRGLHNEVPDQYRTQNGNLVHFVIWDGSNEEHRVYGANVLSVDYSNNDPTDSIGDAAKITDKFLNGTVLNSGPEEAVIEITNQFPPFLGTKIRLDMSDPKRPKRTDETGKVEEAGSNHEVWVDFGWRGPSEGDFFRPFNTITAAAAAVADGGVIKIMPGWTNERPFLANNKRMRLVAPIGGVTIGVR